MTTHKYQQQDLVRQEKWDEVHKNAERIMKEWDRNKYNPNNKIAWQNDPLYFANKKISDS